MLSCAGDLQTSSDCYCETALLEWRMKNNVLKMATRQLICRVSLGSKPFVAEESLRCRASAARMRRREQQLAVESVHRAPPPSQRTGIWAVLSELDQT